MEFERLIRQVKFDMMDRRVLHACQAFADVLANGEWFKSVNREITIKRSFTEVIGVAVGVPSATDEKIKESSITTEITFTGGKEAYRYESELDLEEYYTVNAQVTESLGYGELPEHIRNELLDLIDSDENMRTRIRRMGSIDGAIELIRQHEVTYYISDSGKIVDYSISTLYQADDEELDRRSYEDADSTDDTMYTASASLDGEVVEWHPDDSETLSEKDIELFSKTFDAVIGQLETKEKFDEMSEYAAIDRDENSRRVLSMIALSSAGFSVPGRLTTASKALFYRVFRDRI